MKSQDLTTFWRRRILAVVLPLLTWTVVYFCVESLHIHGVPTMFERTGGIASSFLTSVGHLGFLLVVGYYHLYFLVLLVEFYLLYPAFLWLLRRSAGHHRALVAASAVLQLLLTAVGHWGLTPTWMQGAAESRELWNYQLYLIAGGVVAWHYDDVHRWLCDHWRLVIATSLTALALVEGLYLAIRLHPSGLGGLSGVSPSDTFQPATVPLCLALIADLYLLGVFITDSRRSERLRSAVAAGARNAYGIYLSQVLTLAALVALGWRRLDHLLPWPLVVAGGAVIIYAVSLALTALLARLPGARATAGRTRVVGSRRRPPTPAATSAVSSRV